MFTGTQSVIDSSYDFLTPYVSVRCQILDADEIGTRYEKQCELCMKATGTIKIFRDLMIYFIVENKCQMKYKDMVLFLHLETFWKFSVQWRI